MFRPTAFMHLLAVIALISGCSFFVPAYDNPVSKRHEKEKEKEQKQLEKEGDSHEHATNSADIFRPEQAH
jgi:hypothetical protein